MTDYTQQLAGFLAGLRYQDLPPAVLARMEELFLDWLGSALAGRASIRSHCSSATPNAWARPTVARRSCPAGGAARRISPPW